MVSTMNRNHWLVDGFKNVLRPGHNFLHHHGHAADDVRTLSWASEPVGSTEMAGAFAASQRSQPIRSRTSKGCWVVGGSAAAFSRSVSEPRGDGAMV